MLSWIPENLTRIDTIYIFTVLFSIFAAAGNPGQKFLPQGECEQVVTHNFYTLCYSDNHRQAKWVMHELTEESIKGKAKRKDNFRPDPMVENPVDKDDYRGSGYDRGHLVPAGDMKYSNVSMSETFYMSNISPQASRFNKGIWNNFENKVRDLVLDIGDAYVITAPVLEPKLKKIKGGISVPGWYYKIIYFPGSQKMVAYLMPNTNLDGHDIEEYQVIVDDIEALTGLDFFAELEDKLERRLESNL